MEAGGWLELAPWPLALLDPEQRIIAANRRFCAVLGRTSAELAALPYSALGRDRDLPAELAAFLALARGAPSASLDKCLVRADGSEIAMHLEMLALDGPVPPGSLLLCLRPAGGGPADAPARERAAELLRGSMRQASACLGHDLREQARLAASFLGALEQHHRDALTRDALALLERARGHADRLLAMLPALADYLRAAVLPAIHAPTGCGEVLERASARLAERHGGAAAVISHDALPTIAADPAALEEVFLQLLENAVVHRRHGSARIHVGCQRAGAQWQFALSDDGPGLPAELQGCLFRPLASGPGAGAGLGLGLARCRLEIERMGGRIWHDPAAGAGTCIRFSLPD